MKLLYIDLFCGAGGTSTGVENARYEGRQCAKVIGCVNHDANAIASHAANHPDAMHFTEDIRTLELSPLIAHIAKMRKLYPDAFVVLWASLECTNFSKAKGGQPRDADSRTLAEHLFRYIEAINPDYIQIENVEEFMSWGDLDENGKPISKDAGRLYQQWVANVCGYGYRFVHRILNSADYGAYTSRRRFFGIFAKGSLPIVFPEPTHSKEVAAGLFGRLHRWKPVREVLDFSDEGESIFGRKKPLVDATLERIYAGLIKFVAGGKEAFMVKWNSTAYYGNGHNHSIDEPAPTLTTKDRLAFVDMQYGNGTPCDIETPAPTVTTNPKHQLVTCKPWIMNTSFKNTGSSIDEPAQTVTANRKWHYLMNPQFQSAGGSVDSPCFTLIARMDKMPPYLIQTEQGEMAIVIEPDDSPAMVKIKQFMALYGIIDIKMRMLRIPELKRIMGFPSDYVLVGTQADQKKFIGNAVEVNMARVLCEALCARLIEEDIKPIRAAA